MTSTSDTVSNVTYDFKSIVESLQDVIMRFDRQYKHLYVNRAAELLTGISKKDFLGKTPEELGFSDELCNIWSEAIDYVFTHKKAHKIEFYLTQDQVIDWRLMPEFDEFSNEVVSIVTIARDITTERKYNDLLEENQRSFKDAFNVSKMATWKLDLIDNNFILNEELCAILDMPFDTDNLLIHQEKFLEKWVHNQDKKKLLKLYENILESSNNNFFILEYRINKTKGTTIYVESTFRKKTNKNGKVISLYGTLRDITDTKNYETKLETLVKKRTKELETSQKKLKDAISLANLSSWELCMTSDNLSVSGWLESKLEESLDNKNGNVNFHVFLDLIHKEDFKLLNQAIERAYKSNDPNYFDTITFRILDRHKAFRNINITIKVDINQDNQPVRLYGSAQDVTHLISNKKEKERLTSILEATADIVCIFDENMQLQYINGAGWEFYQISNHDQLKDHVEFIQHDICKIVKDNNVRNQIDGMPGRWIGENVITKQDGTLIPVSQIIIAHRLYKGDLDCYSTIIRDMSDQKQIENDLKFKNKELDTFVYRVSHDLRGPIASMLGLYNVVMHEVKDNTALSFFEMYNQQIHRLNETILALIDLTRIKETEVNEELIDFEELVETSIESFHHLNGFKYSEFNIKYLIKKEYYGDKSLVGTIIQNLIENAIKYYRIEQKNYIEIEIKSTNSNLLVIEISDCGKGIKDEAQSKVFDMFYRADDSGIIGSGLGLYILKNTVDKLKGSVNFITKVNAGTKFTVTLPYN